MVSEHPPSSKQPEAFRFSTTPSPELGELLEPTVDDTTRPDAHFEAIELPEDWESIS